MKARTVAVTLAVLVLVGVVALGWTVAVRADGPWGGTMMGGYGYGYGDMAPTCGGGGWGWPGNAQGEPISGEEALRIAQEYVATYNNPDLEVAEIMEFDNHFYVQAREESTGRYAFEFLIDRYSGQAYPEPGPNMMWNAKYGHMAGWGGMMGGMMGGWQVPASGEMRITPEEAVALAQAYLDRVSPGLEADEEADAFYGYYTLHIKKDGEIVGMLSVHGYTGDVWPHTWHGEFVGMVYGEEDH